MYKYELKRQAEQIARDMLYDFCETIKYGSKERILEWWNDPVKKVYRLAIGQYFQKGAAIRNIPFDEFCAALSNCSFGYFFQEMREAWKFPKYSRTKAKKFKIGKGCTAPDTGDYYGYE